MSNLGTLEKDHLFHIRSKKMMMENEFAKYKKNPNEENLLYLRCHYENLKAEIERYVKSYQCHDVSDIFSRIEKYKAELTYEWGVKSNV
jgi:hypothetical protein